MNNALDYSVLESALTKVDSEKDPSEIHGTLCGLLCANPASNSDDWLYVFFTQFEPDNLLFCEVYEQIQALQHSSLEQLNDPTCDFQLLIPDDSHPLNDKITALGDWCQGFLFGLNAGGVSEIETLPEDSREIIRDLLEIARIGTSYEYSGSEEDEKAYEQFVEYVRMGVLLINEELHPCKAPAKPMIH